MSANADISPRTAGESALCEGAEVPSLPCAKGGGKRKAFDGGIAVALRNSFLLNVKPLFHSLSQMTREFSKRCVWEAAPYEAVSYGQYVYKYSLYTLNFTEFQFLSVTAVFFAFPRNFGNLNFPYGGTGKAFIYGFVKFRHICRRVP